MASDSYGDGGSDSTPTSNPPSGMESASTKGVDTDASTRAIYEGHTGGGHAGVVEADSGEEDSGASIGEESSASTVSGAGYVAENDSEETSGAGSREKTSVSE